MSAVTGTSDDIRRAYDRVLAGTAVRSSIVEIGGRRVHLLQGGSGAPIVLLPGAGGTAGLFAPLLDELRGVRIIAPDRPGQGLSEPVDLPRTRYRDRAVAWLDRLVDGLGLDTTTLLGHSGGAMWALWYALDRPARVDRLVLIGPPAVPGTRAGLPHRVAGTPGLGELVSRLVTPSPASVLRFAHHAARERETLARYPELVDLFVATSADPVTDRVGRDEVRVFVSPFALLTRSGLRRRARVRPDELRRLTVPTMVIWGDREPLGAVLVAEALTAAIPRARLAALPGGHAPWLGQPARVAAAVTDFMR
jgi:pimeloyl-ACP methyl ester carboxylesterase